MSKGFYKVLFICFFLSFVQSVCGQDIVPVDTIKKPGKIHHFVGFPAILHSPELSWAFGGAGSYYFKFSHKDSAARTSFMQALGIATLRRQLVFGLDGTIFFPNERYILRIHGSISRFPDRFWGLGNNSPHSDREAYSISQYYLFPQLLRNVYKKFYVGIAYESQNVFAFRYGQDKPAGQSVFDRQNVSGRYGSFTSGAGMILLWDSRNNAFSSSDGFYFQYALSEYRKGLGSQYNYLSHNLDMRKYFLVGSTSVLAFQYVASFNTGNVPIRSLVSIGNGNIMRGYYDGRFTDKNLMAIQAEFRQHIINRFGVVAFAGVGRVARSFSEFSLSGLKPSFGGGLRLAIDRKEQLNVRVDAGFGKNGNNGIYLNLSEAF
jgi:Omp85 superfamily domain